ncbi:MAG: hypothetical protein AAGJ46_14465 [Planctomycetota bacterium]
MRNITRDLRRDLDELRGAAYGPLRLPDGGGGTTTAGPTHTHGAAVLTTTLTAAEVDWGGDPQVTFGSGRGYLIDSSGNLIGAGATVAHFQTTSQISTDEVNSLSVTWPANLTADDIALLWVISAGQTPTETPTGWTARQTASFAGVSLVLYTKTVAGDESGSIVLAFGDTVDRSAVLSVYRNAETTSLVSASEVGTSSPDEQADSPAVTTTADNSLVIRACAALDDGSTGAGFTNTNGSERISGAGGGATTPSPDWLITEETQSTAGDSGSESWTHTSETVQVAITIALAPLDQITFFNRYPDEIDVPTGRAFLGEYLKDGASYYFYPGCNDVAAPPEPTS